MPIVTQFRASGDPSGLEAILVAQAARARTAATASGASNASPLPDSHPTPPGSAQCSTPPAPSTSVPDAALKASDVRAEDVPLWLPSALPTLLRASLAPGLVNKERRLRVAQADDALEDIRRLRRIITGIVEFKRLNVDGAGQRTSTKTRTLFAKFQEKIRRAASRYRAARAALETLDAGGQWQSQFKILLDTDLRGPGRNDDNTSTSEGRYQISWIWLVSRGPGDTTVLNGVQTELDPNEFLENMKVEWARSQARAERWREDILLLEDEMRRVIEYFEWKATWWRKQAARCSELATALQRGLGAYAEFQASIFERLASHCAKLWIPYLRKRDRVLPGWTARYPVTEVEKKGQTRRTMASDARAGTSVSTTEPVEVSEESDVLDSESDSDASSSSGNAD